MNNFITLTKVFFLSGFNVNQRKQNQKSAFAMLGATLGLFALMSLIICFSLSSQLEKIGMPLITILFLLLIASMMLNFVMSMYQLQSVLFNAKDYELLESLPVSKVCIIASKLTAIYLINLFEDIALILPASIMYMIKGGDVTTGLLAVLMSFFVSFVPILVSTLIGAISALLSARSKYSNIINIIVSLAFFLAFFGVYTYFAIVGPEKLANISDYVFFIGWMNYGIAGEYLSLLYFILFNLGIGLLVVLFVSLIYRPVNSWMKSGGVHVDYDKVKKANEKNDLNINKVLLKKDWQMIYRRPTYLINSVLGCLFFLIAGISFIFIPNIFMQESMDPTEREIMQMIFIYLVPMMGLFMNSIQSPASCSISFETRYGYEMLLTYPITPKDIIKPKLLIAVIMEVVLNLIASTAIMLTLIFTNNINWIVFVELYLYPQLAGLLLAIVSMICGLRWAKLDFQNEAQVFKNSAATGFPLLFVMLPALIPSGIHIACAVMSKDLPYLNYVSLGVITLLYVAEIISSMLILKNKGTKLFRNIINK